MKHGHDGPRPGRVAEPVQVYLEPPDSDRLARLAARLEATKSDVMRRGLAALERELTDPAHDPILAFIGLADDAAEGRDPGYDVAREHDRDLAAAAPAPKPRAAPPHRGKRRAR